MQELKNCMECGVETTEAGKDCPACGHPLRSVRNTRRRGWAMVFLGGFLVLFGTGLALVVPGLMARVPLNAELPISSTQLVLVLTLLAAFGLIGMVAGISMIRTGRTNRVLLSVAGMLLLAMFVWMQSTNQAASHRESAPAVWVR